MNIFRRPNKKDPIELRGILADHIYTYKYMYPYRSIYGYMTVSLSSDEHMFASKLVSRFITRAPIIKDEVKLEFDKQKTSIIKRTIKRIKRWTMET